jgi:hypothetical protein
MIDYNEVLPSAYPDGTGGPKKMAPAKKPISAAAGVQGKSNGLYPKRAPSYGDPNALGDCAAAVLGL